MANLRRHERTHARRDDTAVTHSHTHSHSHTHDQDHDDDHDDDRDDDSPGTRQGTPARSLRRLPRMSYRGVDGVDGMLLRLIRAVPGRQLRSFERWVRGRDEARKLALANRVFVSWAKSGRTWLRAMLANYYEREYQIARMGLLDFDNFHRQVPQIPIVFFTHGNYLRDYTKHYDSKIDFYGKRVLLLVRDPRDTAVSQYFQWRYRMSDWKRKLTTSRDLTDDSIFEFVMGRDYGIPKIIDFLNGWATEASRVQSLRVIRYEDMRADPARVLGDVLEFFGTPGTAANVQAAVEFAKFENLRRLEAEKAFRGRRLAPTDPDNPDSFKVRRGKVGGYRDYFDDAQIAAIDRLTSTTLASFYGYPETYTCGPSY